MRGGAVTETWVFDKVLDPDTFNASIDKNISFKSNNTSYSRLRCELSGVGPAAVCYLYYNDTTVYNMNGGYSAWTNDNYKTITFDEPVTDSTLLAWLQANGTKQ